MLAGSSAPALNCRQPRLHDSLPSNRPKKADGETAGTHEPKPVSPAQLLYAKKIAQGKGLAIPDEAKASSAAMSAWIDANRGSRRRKPGRTRRRAA